MEPVEKLLAIEDIRQLKARYAHYTDQKDSKSWADLYTEDAEVDMSDCLTPRDPITHDVLPVQGFDSDWLTSTMAAVPWPLRGKDQIYAFHHGQIHASGLTGPSGVEALCVATQHGCFNGIIEIESDSAASAIWPVRVFAKYADQAPISRVWFPANYHETYVKQGGKWLIKTLRLEVTWLDALGPDAV